MREEVVFFFASLRHFDFLNYETETHSVLNPSLRHSDLNRWMTGHFVQLFTPQRKI